MSTAPDYWGARAAEYNDLIRRVVPDYELQLDRLFAYLPDHAERIVELGCGTGNVSLRLAGRWPDARLTLVDAAAEMIELTRARLEKAYPQTARSARFVAARFEDLDLDPAGHDLAVASLSLHHVQDIAHVYPRLAESLVIGSRFVMLDGVRGETDLIHEIHMKRWAAYWDGRLDNAERADVVEHVRLHDYYRTFGEHVELLEAAGFTHVDCVWRDGVFTLVTAERSSASPPV
jgi:tRNA (cmo5U34)-methyltransferase